MDYKILLTKEQISEKVSEIAKNISFEYKDKNPLLVGILKGAYIFLSDLSRSITIPHTVDFMAVSSYGSSTSTSGVVRILKDLDTPLFHRHVIIVEDIIDSGLTLRYLKRLFASRSPSSLAVCALLNKGDGLNEQDVLEYTGFQIPKHFVVGYGLDYDQQYRNLPFIAFFESAPETVDNV